jgi:protein SSD1
MRERRIESGTLSIQSLRLKFDLDESGAPVDCSDEMQTEANHLVAEVCCLLTYVFIPTNLFLCSS